MRKAKITAAIIAKNEEKNIEPCIESVRGWVDEIIVVDGYSDDNTASIAEKLGARVIKHKFEGDFSQERNIAIENATSDWILHMDADERATNEFKEKAGQILDNARDIDVFKFKRENFFLGHHMRHGGWCHYIPNLARRNVKFEGALHERPVYSGKVEVIEAGIEHYPFQSIAQFVERHNRYSSVEAEELFKTHGASRLNEVKKQAIRRTFKLFWKMYVKKKGYKEGMYGLIFAILFAFTNFLIWIKYWELCQTGEKPLNTKL